MDLHHFPLWEKEVHDVLQECFQDMQSIFAFYCKSIGGSDSAEAAVEMNMSEFKARDRVRVRVRIRVRVRFNPNQAAACRSAACPTACLGPTRHGAPAPGRSQHTTRPSVVTWLGLGLGCVCVAESVMTWLGLGLGLELGLGLG